MIMNITIFSKHINKTFWQDYLSILLIEFQTMFFPICPLFSVAYLI